MTNPAQEYKVRRLSPTGKILLAEIIPALKGLSAGKALLIQDTPARIDQVRSHLYTYFSDTSQKRYFRTVRESATSLRIVCQDLTPSTLTVDFNPIETFIIENLLSCENLEEASAIARSALTAGEITEEAFLLILEEWEARVSLGASATSQVIDAKEFEKPRINPFNGSIKPPKGKGEIDE